MSVKLIWDDLTEARLTAATAPSPRRAWVSLARSPLRVQSTRLVRLCTASPPACLQVAPSPPPCSTPPAIGRGPSRALTRSHS